MLLISRRTLYFQALLICLTAAGGLLGGYLVGRGLGPAAGPATGGQGGVEIIGNIAYRDADGRQTPDFGAVAIALPEGRQAQIRVAGLAPGDGDVRARRVGEAAIEELGGGYIRSDAAGRFTLKLAQPGRYHLLLISHGGQRPQGRPIAPVHLRQLQRYFDTPANLLGGRKYVLVSREIKDAQVSIIHDF